MKTSKIVKTALSGLLACSLAACGSSSSASASASSGSASSDEYSYLLDTSDLEKPTLDLSNPTGVLKDIIDSGTLSVATSPDFPPNEWVDDSGKVYGSEMMFAKYIADCLGVSLNIETMDFSGTLVAVDTGKTDIAMSGYGWKKDREESYELSKGYIGDPDSDAGQTLITTKANEGKYNSLQDFVGSTIMAQATSLQEMYVQDEILSLDKDGTTKYEAVKTLDQAILGLASGKCDAVALAQATAENYVEQSDGQFVMTSVMFDLTPYGDYQGNVLAAKKGETALIDVMNQIIDFVNEKGYYQTWYTQAKEASKTE